MDYLWTTYGLPMDYLWTSYGTTPSLHRSCTGVFGDSGAGARGSPQWERAACANLGPDKPVLASPISCEAIGLAPLGCLTQVENLFMKKTRLLLFPCVLLAWLTVTRPCAGARPGQGGPSGAV